MIICIIESRYEETPTCFMASTPDPVLLGAVCPFEKLRHLYIGDIAVNHETTLGVLLCERDFCSPSRTFTARQTEPKWAIFKAQYSISLTSHLYLHLSRYICFSVAESTAKSLQTTIFHDDHLGGYSLVLPVLDANSA